MQGHRTTNPAPPEIMHVFGKPRPAVIHRTMPYNLVSEAIANLRAAENTWWANRLCLIFLMLTSVRSKNVRLATWDEIDIPNACWTLKHTRMKSGKLFQVPLSRQALQVLAYAKLLGGGSGSDLIFPPKRSLEPIRPSHLAVITTRLHISSSPHGFRQCITNWARGSKKRYAKGPVEMLLAHVPSKAVREAYETDDFYDLRTPIMQHWADFVSKPIGPITPPVKLGPSAPYIDDEFIEPLRQIMQEWDDFNSRTTNPDTTSHQQPSPTSETKPKAPAKRKGPKSRKIPGYPREPQQTDPQITNRRHPPAAESPTGTKGRSPHTRGKTPPSPSQQRRQPPPDEKCRALLKLPGPVPTRQDAVPRLREPETAGRLPTPRSEKPRSASNKEWLADDSFAIFAAR